MFPLKCITVMNEQFGLIDLDNLTFAPFPTFPGRRAIKMTDDFVVSSDGKQLAFLVKYYDSIFVSIIVIDLNLRKVFEELTPVDEYNQKFLDIDALKLVSFQDDIFIFTLIGDKKLVEFVSVYYEESGCKKLHPISSDTFGTANVDELKFSDGSKIMCLYNECTFIDASGTEFELSGEMLDAVEYRKMDVLMVVHDDKILLTENRVCHKDENCEHFIYTFEINQQGETFLVNTEKLALDRHLYGKVIDFKIAPSGQFIIIFNLKHSLRFWLEDDIFEELSTSKNYNLVFYQSSSDNIKKFSSKILDNGNNLKLHPIVCAPQDLIVAIQTLENVVPSYISKDLIQLIIGYIVNKIFP